MVEKKFIYRLEALKRLKEWDQNDARQEVSQAITVLETKEKEEALAKQNCDAAQDKIRGLFKENADIDPTYYEMVQAYCGETQTRLESSKQATSNAQNSLEKAREDLVDKSCQAKVMENHKHRTKSSFRNSQLLNSYKASDDLWMMRNGRGNK